MTVPDARSDALDLLEKQIGVLFRLDSRLRITGINEPGGREAPRVFLGRTAQGNLCRVRADLPDSLARELQGIADGEPVVDDLRRPRATSQGLRRALDAHARIIAEFRGPAYLLPEMPVEDRDVVRIEEENAGLLDPGFPGMRDGLAAADPVFAIVRDGRAVSICHSARRGGKACEAGVETVPGFRRRGLGAAVVARWAAEVQRSGRLALYSTTWENEASIAVAARLGGVCYAEDFHLT